MYEHFYLDEYTFVTLLACAHLSQHNFTFSSLDALIKTWKCDLLAIFLLFAAHFAAL